MTDIMNRFVARKATPPKTRAATNRQDDFQEIHLAFKGQQGAKQASRCAQCGVPFCQSACPLHNSIPDWLRLTAQGRLEEAYQLAAATNSMPEICGRICPQDRLCEGDCVIEQSGHGAVTIGAIEKHITETAWEKDWIAPLAPRQVLATSIGIIGAGPAGLSAAESLRAQGHRVTVYDRHDRAGGLLVYGIPSFKLEKHIVARRVRRLEAGGIAFQLNCEIGRDLSFAALRARHDAILIATGVYAARPLQLPNAGNAHLALDYLIGANRTAFGEASTAPDAKGKAVIVIGGGDTAMDCVRTAVRQGAASVTCLYRRERQHMPGSRREVQYAQEEGVRFIWLAAPKAITGGAAPGLQAVRLHWPQGQGQTAAVGEEVPGSAFHLPADLIIAALGFTPEPLPDLWQTPDLAASPQGTLRVDAQFATTLPGVFAAGDIVRGASLVVWALRHGREAARSIHSYLSQQADLARIAAQ
jgi:glutamate synthase (NADPH) small chain